MQRVGMQLYTFTAHDKGKLALFVDCKVSGSQFSANSEVLLTALDICQTDHFVSVCTS